MAKLRAASGDVGKDRGNEIKKAFKNPIKGGKTVAASRYFKKAK